MVIGPARCPLPLASRDPALFPSWRAEQPPFWQNEPKLRINVFPALKGGDFQCRRRTFPPDTENVQSCVNVPIVRRTAVRTFPVPYSKRAHTLWTAVGNYPAARARLGSPSFIGLDIPRSVPAGLVAKLVAERRPTGVEHGLCHPCLR